MRHFLRQRRLSSVGFPEIGTKVVIRDNCGKKILSSYGESPSGQENYLVWILVNYS